MDLLLLLLRRWLLVAMMATLMHSVSGQQEDLDSARGGESVRVSAGRHRVPRPGASGPGQRTFAGADTDADGFDGPGSSAERFPRAELAGEASVDADVFVSALSAGGSRAAMARNKLGRGEDLWCTGGEPLAAGALCSPTYDPRNAAFQKCYAEQSCVSVTCAFPLPGDTCTTDAECGAEDNGCYADRCALKNGFAAPVIQMRCLSGGQCGFLSTVGEPCAKDGDCASNHCQDGKRCRGVREGSVCNTTTPGNPCDRGLACVEEFTDEGRDGAGDGRGGASVGMGVCREVEPDSCILMSPMASVEAAMDQCPPGRVCQLHDGARALRAGAAPSAARRLGGVPGGKCVPFFSVPEGGSCSGPLGRLLCAEGLSCVGPVPFAGGGATEETGFVCVNTGGVCNATHECPRSSYCACGSGPEDIQVSSSVDIGVAIPPVHHAAASIASGVSGSASSGVSSSDSGSGSGGGSGSSGGDDGGVPPGMCVELGNANSCLSLWSTYSECMLRYQCQNHEWFSVAAADSSMCAFQCTQEYEDLHCCLAMGIENYWTALACPARFIRIGVSVGIMIGGAGIGLLLGLGFGCWWAKRYSKIDERFVKLAAQLQRGETRGSSASVSGHSTTTPLQKH